MFPDELYLVEYDDGWVSKFANGSKRLQKILNAHLVKIHHIGSTAIPGLCAKPIIDMLVEVKSFPDCEIWIKILVSNGYQYIDKWNTLMPFRRLFVRYENDDYDGHVLEHIHIVEAGHPFVKRHVLFRDYLMFSLPDKVAYCRMKQELISRGVKRSDYNDFKTDFIHSIDHKAYFWKHQKDLPVDYYENT
ncbi:MAG: GrpB family protein [Candidatus Heimdallarchaeota archaeon]|nr:GrpB family protein [Candidatus Heimdallarchaeota archaeon]